MSERSESKELRLLFKVLKGHDFIRAEKANNNSNQPRARTARSAFLDS
jgi:hypothetical protein